VSDVRLFTVPSDASPNDVRLFAGVVNVTVAPERGLLTLTGFEPSVAANASASPGVGSLVLAGLAPDVTVGSAAVDVTVTPDTGALVITGYAPTVSTGAAQEEVQTRSLGGLEDPYYYKKRKKKQPEPVSKDFGDDWKPPTPRPAPPATLPLPAREIIARQEAGFAKTQAAIAQALELMARQQAEADALAYELAEQEDEDEAILLLMAA
jgi:hypothetical protein